MTRYVMVIDLRCCVGCQTCTAACKLANGTPPGVQWRRVLDLESGEYPDVRRTFVPADVPAGWRLIKSGRAGDVGYHLATNARGVPEE